MKKFLTALLCATVAVLSVFGFSACKKQTGEITVYMPDGAPALAMAKLMNDSEDFGKGVTYHVVSADDIRTYVSYTDSSKNADLCVMPVNEASQINGKGYKMLGAVTHGNLYIVANKEAEELTNENFAEAFGGKKIGVVQLPRFPGVMLKTLLSKYEITATLSAVQPAQVDGNDAAYDYFVLPEPAASTRVGNAATNLKIVGDLQSLYGNGGYPQAVLMAKTSLIENQKKFVESFIEKLTESAQWLLGEGTTSETVLSAIKAHYPDPENTTPAFNNLTKPVIQRCSVRFESAASCKEKVKTLLAEFKAVSADFANTVEDGFFWLPL